MKYFAIIGRWNWADEMDVETLTILTETELEHRRNKVDEVISDTPQLTVGVSVGTNEQISISITEVKDFLGKAIEVPKEVSDNIADVNTDIYCLFFNSYTYLKSEKDDDCHEKELTYKDLIRMMESRVKK